MSMKKSDVIAKVKAKLIARFLIVDIGFISFYLGLKIEKNQENKTIKLFQLAYINNILLKFHLNQANPTNTLMKKLAILLLCIERQTTNAEIKKYQQIIGFLMFSMVETQPNIVFSIFVANCFLKNLSHQYMEVVKTILKYLKGSKTQRIIYRREEELKI